jgi:hypothetical protein
METALTEHLESTQLHSETKAARDTDAVKSEGRGTDLEVIDGEDGEAGREEAGSSGQAELPAVRDSAGENQVDRAVNHEQDVGRIVGEGTADVPLTNETGVKEKEDNLAEGGDSHDGGDDTHSVSGIARTDTPGSRTSTPPPGQLSTTAPKKFSALNVTKKFLSKTGQPAVTPAPGSKLGLNGELACHYS